MAMLQTISGKWHLTYTNFAMWKHDSISDVTFNYTPAEKDRKHCFLDEVKYIRNNKSKSIVGYDFADDNDERKFIWQGKGWMFWIKSHWKVEWMNNAETCIVLSFEKTLLTAGGVDIITRGKDPAPQILEEAFAFIKSNGSLQAKAQNMILVLQH